MPCFAISQDERRYVIDPDLCVECGACESVCRRCTKAGVITIYNGTASGQSVYACPVCINGKIWSKHDFVEPDGLKHIFPLYRPPGADSFALSYFASRQSMISPAGSATSAREAGLSRFCSQAAAGGEISAVSGRTRLQRAEGNASQPGIPGINTVQGDIRHINSIWEPAYLILSFQTRRILSRGRKNLRTKRSAERYFMRYTGICCGYLPVENGGKFFMCFR